MPRKVAKNTYNGHQTKLPSSRPNLRGCATRLKSAAQYRGSPGIGSPRTGSNLSSYGSYGYAGIGSPRAGSNRKKLKKAVFFSISEHADGERRGARSSREGGVGKVSARRTFRYLQIDPGPRRSPSACSEIIKKTALEPREVEEARGERRAGGYRGIFGDFSGHADGERRGLD